MIDIEKGRYWDEGIQLVDGCTPCSPGCDRCWSAAMTHRFDKFGDELHSLTTEDKPVFNGNVITHPERLSRFNTRKPKVFAIWNDLFHEDVPDAFIMATFGAMPTDILQPCLNTYLVLTKRPQRMRDFFLRYTKNGTEPWPNVYLGLTVCSQQEADEKIPIFLQAPGKKFLSIEPMLGEIDLTMKAPKAYSLLSKFYGHNGFDETGSQLQKDRMNYFPKIDAVILGGKTGPGARPMHPDWVRSVRDQCAAAGVPFFFKGWGEWVPWGDDCCDFMHDFNSDEMVKKFKSITMEPYIMYCVGRNKAGRLLDGRTHDDLPWR